MKDSKSTNYESLELQLKGLCVDVIQELKLLHSEGTITKKELDENTKMKREFIDRIE